MGNSLPSLEQTTHCLFIESKGPDLCIGAWTMPFVSINVGKNIYL